MTIRKITMAIACAVVSMMAVDVKADVVLGSFEFTDNSLAFTDADGADGITVSDLGINSYTSAELFSDFADTAADSTLDFLSVSGSESSSGTGTAFTAGEFFSITINNNSGSVLDLRSLSGDFLRQNVFQQFTGRIFDTTTPNVLPDTLGRVGASSGTGTDTSFVNEIGFLDGTDPVPGSTAGAVSIADGNSLTLHWVPIMNSTSNTRSLLIDNLTLTSAVAVPEPSSLVLLGFGALAFIGRRRK